MLLLTAAMTPLVQGAFSPTRISFDSLVQQDTSSHDDFLRALREVGMVSITGMPYFESKMKTLNALPACMSKSYPEFAVEKTFPDGTRRQTLAAHSIGNTGVSPLPVVPGDENCDLFLDVSESFRQEVGSVLEAFAERLAQALNLDQSRPILMGKDTGAGWPLTGLFSQGDQLEHFHCYFKDDDSSTHADETIEWHTDQGLALIFTPGSVDGKPTDGFYIQLQDGSTEMVDFQESDDLVILLGDGVNQYLNPALEDVGANLRALPHALRMPTTTSNNNPRVWYGRMVLPPSNAMHPLHPWTFGEIRDQMMGNSKDSIASLIGCSDDLLARELSETTCEPGVSAYCWHQCMNYSSYGVSPKICSQKNLQLACVNPQGFLWVNSVHDPAFRLGCADLATAQNVSVTSDGGQSGGTTNETIPPTTMTKTPSGSVDWKALTWFVTVLPLAMLVFY